MTAKHSPATSLPWDGPVNYGVSKFEVQGPHSRLATVDKLPDAAYIVHAANAYPKLVEALRRSKSMLTTSLAALDAVATGATLTKAEEFAGNIRRDTRASLQETQALLRELGEAE